MKQLNPTIILFCVWKRILRHEAAVHEQILEVIYDRCTAIWNANPANETAIIYSLLQFHDHVIHVPSHVFFCPNKMNYRCSWDFTVWNHEVPCFPNKNNFNWFTEVVMNKVQCVPIFPGHFVCQCIALLNRRVLYIAPAVSARLSGLLLQSIK